MFSAKRVKNIRVKDIQVKDVRGIRSAAIELDVIDPAIPDRSLLDRRGGHFNMSVGGAPRKLDPHRLRYQRSAERRSR